MLSRDEVIGIVAKEHGILISKDDPILAFLSVHQVLMNEYANSIGREAELANQSFAQALKEAQEKYVEQSKELANQIVGKAVNEFSTAEKNLAKQISNIELTKHSYNGRFNRLELWLACLSCATLLIICCLLAIIFGVIK